MFVLDFIGMFVFFFAGLLWQINKVFEQEKGVAYFSYTYKKDKSSQGKDTLSSQRILELMKSGGDLRN